MEYRKITNGILSTNTYLLIKDKKCIIIDPSIDHKLIDKELLNLEPQAIILTHGHFDHIASCDYFAKKYQIDIYVYRKTYDFLYSSSLNLSKNSNFTHEFILETPAKKFSDELRVGAFDFQIIPTPGHTSGCCSYIIENYLFTGDFLFKNSRGRTDFITSNDDAMKKSLNKLKRLPSSLIILAGHGDVTTLKDELIFNPYLR